MPARKDGPPGTKQAIKDLTPKRPASKRTKKNDNPQADEKPRPRSPRNGVELPIGKPFTPGERAREIGRKGGIRAAQLQAQRKSFKEEFLALLAIETNDSEGRPHTQNEIISAAMIREARGGNVKAFELIRDTIGEKIQERVDMTVNLPQFENLDAAFAKMCGDGE